MDFEHLQLFKDIVQTRSISKGAAMNGVTQSAASQAVQEMERGFGVELLDRTHRPLRVLAAGQMVYDFAREVLRRRHDLEAQIDHLREGAGGVLRVAAIYSVGLSEMTRLEEAFYQRLPAARLEVSYLRPEKVYQAVAEERVDLGLVSYPESTREIVAAPWREETMVVACNPRHRLAQRDSVRPEDLEDVEFIGFDEDLPISRDIERFLREHGVKVRIVMRFDNIQSMKEALRLEQAVSILPLPMLKSDIAEGRLKAVEMEAPLRRPLGIIQRRRRAMPRGAQVFLELLRDPAA